MFCRSWPLGREPCAGTVGMRDGWTAEAVTSRAPVGPAAAGNLIPFAAGPTAFDAMDRRGADMTRGGVG